MKPYGKTLSTIVKTNKSGEQVILYNTNNFIIKGDLKKYSARYKKIMNKKSNVKKPGFNKLNKSIRSIVKYSLTHMMGVKKFKFKVYEDNFQFDGMQHVMCEKVKLPIKIGFTLEQLINEL